MTRELIDKIIRGQRRAAMVGVFSTSAAVGFISLFGAAIMDGLLMTSYFNSLRAHGHNLHDSIMAGAAKHVRPVIQTAMTALFGLLPAAFSTKIGLQTQRPLAIVGVGGWPPRFCSPVT